MADVILHAFDWKFADVAAKASRIAELGYGAVLLSPPLYSDENGPQWWQRYQPKDYRVIRSYLGRKADLIAAVEALHAHGVRVFADIVFNHMANERRPDPLDFPGAAELERYCREQKEFEADRLYGDLSRPLFTPNDFNTNGNIQDWLSQYQSTECSLSGLPDLDLNDNVVGQQRECLRALNGLGFDGYRVDAVKHLAGEHIRRVFESGDLAGKYLFGEALTTNDREEHIFLWPLLGETGMCFYDFPLHETMRRVFSPGGSMRELADPAAYGQALPSPRAVTFTVTHDIPNNDGFRSLLLDRQDEYLATAYIMARDGGVPLIYSDHNESAARFPEDRNRWNNAWKREDIAAMLAFHNAVNGLPQLLLYEDDGFLVLARGDRAFVAINKTGEWRTPYIQTGSLRNGAYRCLLHGYIMLLETDPFIFAIPPRQAQLWLHEGP